MKIAAICMTVVCIALSSFAQSYVVVVNKSNALSSISSAQLKFIYSGKLKEMNGAQLVPIDLPAESPATAAFLRDHLKMGPEQYKEFWVAQQVKGAGTAPMVQKTSDAVLAIVSQIPGAIGYVETGKANDAVKVLAVK